MAIIDLDVELSDEERTVRDTVHKFAPEVLRPAPPPCGPWQYSAELRKLP